MFRSTIFTAFLFALQPFGIAFAEGGVLRGIILNRARDGRHVCQFLVTAKEVQIRRPRFRNSGLLSGSQSPRIRLKEYLARRLIDKPHKMQKVPPCSIAMQKEAVLVKYRFPMRTAVQLWS